MGSQHGLFLIEVKNEKYKSLEATLKAKHFLQIDPLKWTLDNVFSQKSRSPRQNRKGKCQLSVKIMSVSRKNLLGLRLQKLWESRRNFQPANFSGNSHILEYHHAASIWKLDGVRDAAGLSLPAMMFLCQFIPVKDPSRHHHVLSSNVLAKINYNFNPVKRSLLQVPDQNNHWTVLVLLVTTCP